ncbi:MAG: hypothetical protein A2Y25_05985 [Candidatus Melainabacteria bacterium GWF2_37_15]|nr:MAG: hypothetical protein A2Y25_05985 [Candidatus Melainabacteria bacterium GWF2_37_15]
MKNKEQNRRWYDKDPILSKAMRILETTDDQFQLKIAFNLIKIIIEHNIEADSYRSVEDILSAVEDGRCERGSERWYDLNETIRTAVQMLENCPEDMQSSVAKNIAFLIKEKIRDSYEAEVAE